MALNFLFVAINIYKQILIVGILCLTINLLSVLFFNKKYAIYTIFMLYPLARVLKLPNISTSFLTIVLIVLFISLIVKFFITKKKLTQEDFFVFFLFVLYFLFTLIVSLVNQNFKVNELLSFYLYLFLPVLMFICIKNNNDINPINNVMLVLVSYLYGFLLVIFFYNIIPGGNDMLKSIGVNIFDDGGGFVRYAPLTDDPNYGTMLLILFSFLFILSKKTNKQIKIGYPLLLTSLGISILSLSKMYLICFTIILFCLIIVLIKKSKNLLVKLSIVLITFSVFVTVFVTPLGQIIITRFIGNSSDISIDLITTGRFNLFGLFSSYILSNPLTLLFGKGPVFFSKEIAIFGDHNTFTKNVFGSGLVGVTIMLILLFIMLRNRLDKTTTFPKNIFFYGFVLCLLLCCMSLTLAPSTVFPIFVTGAQFIHLNKTNTFSIKKTGDNLC